jgi:N-acylneuraminate cytidylyltransferase
MVKHEVLAIIPARGGSKGIPRKNIRNFAGYPLIAYSIAAGLQSELVTRVIVSTDDEEIACVAREFGAKTPFLRPAELAQDQSTDLPLFEQALQWLRENEGYVPDAVVQLRPTSPIRPVSLVDDAVRMLLDTPDADCVRGVVSAGQNPYKMWQIDPDSGRMSPLLKVEGIAEPYNAPRQALPAAYWQTGHIDAIRTRTILEKHSLTGDVILPLIIDSRYTVDIDTLSDWARYESVVYSANLAMVTPGNRRRPLPDDIRLLVLDFDGVVTDNHVYVDDEGKEMVMAYRSDSIGVQALQKAGIQVIVLSSEMNPVVTARCRKMGISAVQGVLDKPVILQEYLHQQMIKNEQVVYLGNDINDTPCFPLVGCAVVVADAQPEAIRQADQVLTRNGGFGAVREMCDIILQSLPERSQHGA